MNLLDRLNNKLVLLEQNDFNRNAIKKVALRVRHGKSKLKKSLEAGELKFSDVVKAIKNDRCLRTPDRDYGATYLEQVIGTAIRETIPTEYINQVRGLFGMKKLPPGELNPRKHQQIQQPQ